MNMRYVENRPLRRIAGLSIVELMVALTIGLILLAALTRLFVSSRSTYTLEEGLARVQESGRFAMEFLAQDIRMAGYAGCSANLSSSDVGNIVAPAASATTFNPDGLAGYKHTCTSSCTGALSEWDPDLPSEYFPSGSITPVTGTDVLIIQRADTTDAHLTGQDSNNANVQISNNATLEGQLAAGDILMVSDCKGADIFRATNVSEGTGKITVAHSSASNTSNRLAHTYDNTAQIMKLVTRVYFIGRRDNSTGNPPALYRKDLGNSGNLITQELVEGVEVMRISYGEASGTNKYIDTYRNPSSVGNWRKIFTTRVGLLVVTTANVEQAEDTRTYNLAGVSVGPYNDKKRRRAFNSIIQVRNHY